MTTTWEQVTETTFSSSDWRYVIEFNGECWTVSERGSVVCSHYSLDRAQRWVSGEVVR
jgi:hypothetical protein